MPTKLDRKIKKDVEKNTLFVTEQALYKAEVFSRIFQYLQEEFTECAGLMIGDGNLVTDVSLLKEMQVAPGQVIFPKPAELFAKKLDYTVIGLWHYHGDFSPDASPADLGLIVEENYSNVKKVEEIERKEHEFEVSEEGKVRIPIREGRFIELDLDGKLKQAYDCYTSSTLIQYFWIFNKDLNFYGVRQEFEWDTFEEKYFSSITNEVTVKIKDSLVDYSLLDLVESVGEVNINGELVKEKKETRFLALIKGIKNSQGDDSEIAHILELEPNKLNSKKLAQEAEYLDSLKRTIVDKLDKPAIVTELLQRFEQYKSQKKEFLESYPEVCRMVEDLEEQIRRYQETFERKLDNLIKRYERKKNPGVSSHILQEMGNMITLLSGLNSDRAKRYLTRKAELEQLLPGRKIEFLLKKKKMYQFDESDMSTITAYLKRVDDSEVQAALFRKIRYVPYDALSFGEKLSVYHCLKSLSEYFPNSAILEREFSLSDSVLKNELRYLASLPYWELDHASSVLKKWGLQERLREKILKRKHYLLSRGKKGLNKLKKRLRAKKISMAEAQGVLKEILDDFGDVDNAPSEIRQLIESMGWMLNEKI